MPHEITLHLKLIYPMKFLFFIPNPHFQFSVPSIRTNDSSSLSSIPGLLKPHFELHVEAYCVQTLCGIGRYIQDLSVIIYLVSPTQCKELMRLTISETKDSIETFCSLVGDYVEYSGGSQQQEEMKKSGS